MGFLDSLRNFWRRVSEAIFGPPSTEELEEEAEELAEEIERVGEELEISQPEQIRIHVKFKARPAGPHKKTDYHTTEWVEFTVYEEATDEELIEAFNESQDDLVAFYIDAREDSH